MAQLKDLLVEGKSRFIDKIYASDQFISKVVQGTSPFLIDSSTLVSNLNVDLLDGFHAFGTDNISNNRYLLKQAKIDIGATTEEAYYRIATLSNGVSSNNRDALFYTIDIIFNRYWLYRVRHRGVSATDREYTIAVIATNSSASDLRIYYGAYNESTEIFVKQVASSTTLKTILTKVFVEGQRGSTLINYIQLDTTPVTTSSYTNYYSGAMSISIPWDNIAGKPSAAISFGYIGTTAVQASQLDGQNITGIGTILWPGATKEILRFSTNNSTWYSGLKYSWSSNTTVALWGKHANTQFVWHAGTDFTANDVNGTTNRGYDFQVGRIDNNLEVRSSGIMNAAAFVEHNTTPTNVFLLKPKSSTYITTTSSVTGAITITLPASIGNTMTSMWIDVYLYSTNKSFSVHVGGYTYNNSTWANSPFAMVYGAEWTVRLGHNGTSFVIYIGETNTSWSYPQVAVRDVICGFSPSSANWEKDFAISFSTSFSNVTATITNYALTTKNLLLDNILTLKAGAYTADATWTYPGGSYASVKYPNMRLIGDPTYGLSTIEFISQKGDTVINKPTDCAFIQFQPYGVTTQTAIGTQPTLASSGEANRLVIGVNNDSTDSLILQTPTTTGLKHAVGTGLYTIWDSGNDGSGSGLDADTVDGIHGTDFVEKRYGRFYPFIASDPTRSIWHKVTFPHTGYTSSSTAWFMLTMEIVLSGSYQNAAAGKIFLNYYFLKDSSNNWSAATVKGIAIGTHITSSGVKIRYDIANPAIFYIKVSTYNYTSFAIENLSANDTAQNYDYRNTTIETIAEADIPSAADKYIPIAVIESNDGSTLIATNLTSDVAKRLAQSPISSLSTFTHTTDLIYTARGGGNSITDKPTNVDAFGVITMKTADGWYGQLLMSANSASGIYWRTGTSLSGGWKQLIDTSNYTSYLGYIGTTPVQASSAAQAVTGITALTFNGATSAGTNYITGTAGRIYFGGNFHLDSLGSNATYINHYTGNNVYLVSGSTQGKVGIGTSSPTTKLEVKGDILINNDFTNEHGIFFRSGFTSSNKYNVSILAYDHGGTTDTPDGLSINGQDGISFCTGSNSRNEVVRITGAGTPGRVGIGTTSPSAKLHVYGGESKFGGNGVQYPVRITRQYNDSVDFLLGSSPLSNLDFRLSNNASGGGTEAFIDLIHGGGGVYISPSLGVNGTNTSYKLYVNGTGNITDTTTLAGSIKILPTISYTTLINSYGLRSDYTSAGYPQEEFLKAWCKYAYANGANYTVLSYISPSSRGMIQADVYSSGLVDQAFINNNHPNAEMGLPVHITGRYYPHAGAEYIFGTSYGVWYHRVALDSANLGSYIGSYTSAYVAKAGDTMTGALTIKGVADTGQYSQGGFNKAYANIILQGDNTYGVSGIVFKSMKSNDTNINSPSDVAFIQYHPYGVTAAAYNTTPTEASSGERSRLVIGIGNDADNGSNSVGEELWLQTAGANDLKHYVVNTAYTILDSGNYAGIADARYVKKAGDTMTGQLYINYDQDVGLNQNGSLVIGTKAGENIAIDGNEIMARNNSSASILYLNNEGGNIVTGSGNVGIGTSPSYKLHVAGTVYSTGQPGFYNSVAAGNWSYLRLHNGSNLWDIATKSNTNSGALDFRPGGVDNIGPLFQTNGMAVFSNSGNTSTGTYSEAAVQIREYHRGGSQSDTWGNAPRLAWHWSGRVAAQIGLASSGWLYEAPLTATNYYRIVVEGSTGITWGINISGNAATATKLGTATVGASNRPIYLNSGTPTAVSSVGEAFLSWGGQNLSSNFGPVDAGILPELGANRAAFISPDNIVVQYSTNGGSSWTDYGASAADKVNLFNGNGAAFRIGKNSTTGVDYTNYRLRIILTPGGLYTTLNKFIILVSTSGSSGCWCTIDARLRSNVNSSTDTWTTFANQVGISGWSGYNVINTSGLTTYGGTPASQYGEIRFTFGNTGYSTSYPGLTVTKIFCIGGVGWTTPSTLARTGHMYTYDASQNVTFPANVTASSFIGNASSATTAAGLSSVIANDKLPARLRELCTSQTVTSGDSATNSGWAYVTGGSPFTHIRSTNDYMLISTGYNASWCAELAENFYSNDIAFRTKNSGTWTEWAYPIMWRPSNQLSNCNDVSVTGIWTNGGFTNRPSDVSNWGSLFNIRLYKDNNTYHRQLFFDCYGTDKIWTRSDNGGSWTAWTELVRNTGTWNISITGSATNADTVDSEHAAAFAHRQTYNNMVHSGNEYTWIAPGYTGGVWINYRTASGTTDGSINEYIFGTGKGTQLAKISLNTFHGNITGSAPYLTLTYCNSSTNSGVWNTIKNGKTNPTTNKVNFYTIYNNGGPTTYGEMLEILSYNANHWQPQLWFGAGKSGHMYYRNKNYNDDTWGDWLTIIDSGNISSYVSDTKVTQTITASSNTSWRPLLLGYSYSDATTFAPATVTNTTYATHLAKFKPSTGQLAIGGLYKMNTNGTQATGANDEVWNTNGTTVKISTLFTTEPEYLTLEVKNATSPSTPITEYVGVTITNKFTNEIIYEGIAYQNTHLVPGTTTYTANPIEIPPGIEYVITCNSISGYSTPAPGTFLSIPGYSRTVTLNFTPIRVDILSVDFSRGSSPAAFIQYTAASGTSVMQWIRANSHRYVAYFAKLTSNVTDGNNAVLSPRGAQMYICQLKDSDSTRFANDNSYLYPTDGSVENGDIYMRLPEFYYRVSGDSSAFTVEFADTDLGQGFQKWDSNNMIAVYPVSYKSGIVVSSGGSTTSSKINAYSSSPYAETKTLTQADVWLNKTSCVVSANTISSSGTTIDLFVGGVDKSSIKNLYPSVDVKFLRYKWIQMLRLLFMAYYQTTNCISECGNGLSTVYTPSAQSTQGRGMNDTTNSTGNNKPVNFWGVEALWNPTICTLYTDACWQYYYVSNNANNVNKIGILADMVGNPNLLSSSDTVYRFGSIANTADTYYGRNIYTFVGTPTTPEQILTYSPIAFTARYSQTGNSAATVSAYWFAGFQNPGSIGTGATRHGGMRCCQDSLFHDATLETGTGYTRICYYGPIQEVYSPTVFYNSIKPNSAIYRRLRGNTAIPPG